MKVLVCISKTPDTTTKIAFTADHSAVNYDGVKFIINPYDEHALAKGMELKENHGAELTVIHVGPADGDQIIRKCFAIGADKGIRVNTDAIDGLQVDKEIVAATSGEQFDAIITGRESIDYNGGMVGEMIGELLGIPSVSYCQQLDIDGNTASMKRFIDGGEESLTAQLPVVVSAVKELGEPRIPNMRGIMQARTKPITVVEPATGAANTTIGKYDAPAQKSGCKYIDACNAEQLIEILHNEKKLF
ncbi:MAG: electron transfer flavoprotein subunit beta/FixA family protein [Bacteroidetes bacterium]|nr:electron transfer flavoprotein subunit beta/FixA family protein [Bacteroidota bacterium]